MAVDILSELIKLRLDHASADVLRLLMTITILFV